MTEAIETCYPNQCEPSEIGTAINLTRATTEQVAAPRPGPSPFDAITGGDILGLAGLGMVAVVLGRAVVRAVR